MELRHFESSSRITNLAVPRTELRFDPDSETDFYFAVLKAARSFRNQALSLDDDLTDSAEDGCIIVKGTVDEAAVDRALYVQDRLDRLHGANFAETVVPSPRYL